jgi:CDP-diacylglycerol--serine O-phosphatidyltransferase
MYKLVLKDYGVWGYPVAFLYVLCGGLRLARFNLKSHFGGGSKDYFQGLPTPGAAGVMISFVLAYSMLEGEGGVRSIPGVSSFMPFVYAGIPFIVVALALLMVSNAPYAAFKGDMIKLNSIKGILFLTAMLSLIVAYPQDALFIFFSIYALSGVFGGLYNLVKGKREPEQA